MPHLRPARPDVYMINKYLIKAKCMGITVTVCPLYVHLDNNEPQDDGKKEWA